MPHRTVRLYVSEHARSRTRGPFPERPLPPTADHPTRFVADAMLGRLARWLRALGFDVVADQGLDDDDLARLARQQNRHLLTRDRRLCAERAHPGWCILLHTHKPAAQLAELDARIGIFSTGWRERTFSRCMVCNTPLAPATHAEVRDDLPDDVRDDPRVRSAGFRRCPGCGRAYWEGSHTRRMRRWLERVADRSEG
ncbi:MAG: Mut7-C RNAse domain-containing protein [Gemmatimonadota bacterium]